MTKYSATAVPAEYTLKESITMLKEINGNGGNARLKICYGVGHEAWETAYDGDELYTWMLSQKKKRK